MAVGYRSKYCRTVRLTDTSDCQGWRKEPRRLGLDSRFSVELAAALKSKSRSPPGLLIVLAQLANIAAPLDNHVHISAHPKDAEAAIVRATSLSTRPHQDGPNQLKRLVKLLCAAKRRTDGKIFTLQNRSPMKAETLFLDRICIVQLRLTAQYTHCLPSWSELTSNEINTSVPFDEKPTHRIGPSPHIVRQRPRRAHHRRCAH